MPPVPGIGDRCGPADGIEVAVVNLAARRGQARGTVTQPRGVKRPAVIGPGGHVPQEIPLDPCAEGPAAAQEDIVVEADLGGIKVPWPVQTPETVQPEAVVGVEIVDRAIDAGHDGARTAKGDLAQEGLETVAGAVRERPLPRPAQRDNAQLMRRALLCQEIGIVADIVIVGEGGEFPVEDEAPPDVPAFAPAQPREDAFDVALSRAGGREFVVFRLRDRAEQELARQSVDLEPAGIFRVQIGRGMIGRHGRGLQRFEDPSVERDDLVRPGPVHRQGRDQGGDVEVERRTGIGFRRAAEEILIGQIGAVARIPYLEGHIEAGGERKAPVAEKIGLRAARVQALPADGAVELDVAIGEGLAVARFQRVERAGAAAERDVGRERHIGMIAERDEIGQAERRARDAARPDRGAQEPVGPFDRRVGHPQVGEIADGHARDAELRVAQVDHPLELVMGRALGADFPQRRRTVLADLAIGSGDEPPFGEAALGPLHLGGGQLQLVLHEMPGRDQDEILHVGGQIGEIGEGARAVRRVLNGQGTDHRDPPLNALVDDGGGGEPPSLVVDLDIAAGFQRVGRRVVLHFVGNHEAALKLGRGFGDAGRAGDGHGEGRRPNRRFGQADGPPATAVARLFRRPSEIQHWQLFFLPLPPSPRRLAGGLATTTRP